MCTYYLFHISNNQHISYLFPCQLKRIMQDQHYVRTENLTKMLYFCVIFNRLVVSLCHIFLQFFSYLNPENGLKVRITYGLERLRRIGKLRNFYKTQNNASYAIYAPCAWNDFHGLLICDIMKSRNRETDSTVSWIYYLSFQ